MAKVKYYAKENSSIGTHSFVYIVYEDCGCDETRNVACLETEEKAKRFCYKRNTSRPYRFHYEEWEVGEVLEGV